MLIPVLQLVAPPVSIGETRATQAAVIASATTSFATRATQVAVTGSFTSTFHTRTTQVALLPSVYTIFSTRATQVALVASVITCDSTSYVPPAPTGLITLTATAGAVDTGTINLSWTPLIGFAFSVGRSTVNGGPYTTIVSGLTASTYQDSGLAFLTTYYYKVTGANVCNDTTVSNQSSATPQCTLPSAPLALTATPGPLPYQATLQWGAVYGATYDLYRAFAPGGERAPFATGLTANDYIDTDLPEGLVYYTVLAVTACGMSDQSAEAFTDVFCCPPWNVGGSCATSYTQGLGCATVWTSGPSPATTWTKGGCGD
jgi:cellulose 1,4-beta-cellobiosidase